VRTKAQEVAELSLELIIQGLTAIVKNPKDTAARTMLGLGTDLGGYAIMIGGTSGAHLTSFSLVDVLSHGRACALMNPYYSVFFAPAAEEQLKVLGRIYRKYGYIEEDLEKLSGRELGLAVARGMVKFSQFLNFPTCLSDVPGVTPDHIERCLKAAKDPQLDMKLRNTFWRRPGMAASIRSRIWNNGATVLRQFSAAVLQCCANLVLRCCSAAVLR
jgi:alcohol dehydrogenase class IV